MPGKAKKPLHLPLDRRYCEHLSASNAEEKNETSMKNEKKIEIATAFKNELASRYDLPELKTATIEANNDGILTTGVVNVQPSGQLSGIVSALRVKVTVGFRADGQAFGDLSYHYDHHSRGSNGSEQEFVLVLEKKYDELNYVGCIGKQLFYQATQNFGR
jgi:hypothetical protein